MQKLGDIVGSPQRSLGFGYAMRFSTGSFRLFPTCCRQRVPKEASAPMEGHFNEVFCMNILAAIFLCSAILAAPMASHADSLDDLDRLLENAQRKRETKEMPGLVVQPPHHPDQRHLGLGRDAGGAEEFDLAPQDDLGKKLENSQRKLEEMEKPVPDVQAPRQPAPVSGTAGDVKEFGSDDFRFTVEVPAGWNAKGIERGVQVEKDDGSSLLVFRKMDAGAMSPSEFASAIGQKFGVEIEKQGDIWYYMGEKEGKPLEIAILHNYKGVVNGLVCISAGSDIDDLRRIFSTVKIVSDKK